MEAPTIGALTTAIKERFATITDSAASAEPAPTVTTPQLSISNAGDTTRTESIVEQKTAKQKSLVTIRKGEAGRPGFFFVHSHGGTVIGYHQLARKMDLQRPIWGLQSQGIRGDVAPLKTIEAMAARYMEEIYALQPDGPYFLGGYCMGGTIAWELARQLRANGSEVGLVALIETFHKKWPTYKDDISRLKKTLLPYLDWVTAVNMRDSGNTPKWRHLIKTICTSGIRQLNTGINIQLDDAGGDPHLAAVHEANGKAFWLYEAGPLDAPVVFYTTQHQPTGIIEDRTLGWSALATGNARQVVIDGSFRNNLDSYDLDTLVDDIEQHILTYTASRRLNEKPLHHASL
jgi:thioesterase domain-containing protein